MVASVLGAAGLDPTFVVGGRVNHAGSNARVGEGEYMVVEADESDGSFLLLAPVVAVITTIDREHLDHYKSLDEIQETFLQFANRFVEQPLERVPSEVSRRWPRCFQLARTSGNPQCAQRLSSRSGRSGAECPGGLDSAGPREIFWRWPQVRRQR